MKKNDGGPAFPESGERGKAAGGEGMSLRDYFAVHGPEPNKGDIDTVQEQERSRNPHNDHYKPKRHSRKEIAAILRYRFADAMLAAREERGES